MNINMYLGESSWKNHMVRDKEHKEILKGQLMIGKKSIKLGAQQDGAEKKTGTISSQDDLNNKSTNVLQEAVKKLQETWLGEDTEERYQKILQKVNNGEELSQKDLEYLKSKDLKLYYEIKSEEMVAKQFEERLKHCKSKEEAQDAYITTMNTAARMCGLKGESKEENKAKFARLAKRLNKVWEKYQKGKLGSKEKTTESTSSEEYKEAGKIQADVIKAQKIEAFERFQLIDKKEEIYSEQM